MSARSVTSRRRSGRCARAAGGHPDRCRGAPGRRAPAGASAGSLLWPSPATLEPLDTLRAAGWRLGLVSNCTAETPELWKRTPLATRFDAVGFSCELGVAKPDPAIYLAVCSFLGVPPTECVYVGDGADSELPAAANLGMAVVRTVEFQPSSAAWPPGPDRRRCPSCRPLTGRPARSPRSAASG